jgi:hypothetical protein
MLSWLWSSSVAEKSEDYTKDKTEYSIKQDCSSQGTGALIVTGGYKVGTATLISSYQTMRSLTVGNESVDVFSSATPVDCGSYTIHVCSKDSLGAMAIFMVCRREGQQGHFNRVVSCTGASGEQVDMTWNGTLQMKHQDSVDKPYQYTVMVNGV